MVVSVAFRVFDEAGELVDTVEPDEPVIYVHGYGELIPGLEERLAGAAVGEHRTISVPPEEAFGLRDPSALLEIDRHDFPAGRDVAVGDEIVAEGPDGIAAVHRVLEIGHDAIVVDLNHPLAGQTVRFEVDVCAIRPATDEELDHAQATADERIAHASTIVYASRPLVQLRPKIAGRSD